MNRIYWVGPRQSDIDYIKFKFAGSITIYGDNTNGNIAYCKIANCRINHNIDNLECNLFFQKKLEEICDKIPDSQFLFYNFLYAYQFSEKIRKHIIGLNTYELLDILSDKIRCRMILNNIIDTVPFITLGGNDCSFNNIQKYFVNTNEFVVQKKYSSGGEGTFLIKKPSDINIAKINDNEEYLISPYLRDSISLNIHLAIINNKTILFPPSIQIVTENQGTLLYHGADFICYNYVSEQMKFKVESISMKIGDYLKKKGYKGILGIDYLICKQNLYFMEINPRFQASSQLVNRGLFESNQNSLFEIHMQAFGMLPAIELKPFIIPYSNYVFSANNISNTRLQKVIISDEIEQIQMDGYNPEYTTNCEKNAFLCRCIFKKNICSLFRSTLTIHPNFFVEEIASQLFKKFRHQNEYIKFALLNHGVTLSKEALQLAKSQGTIRDAVFDAIDITIFNGISVNVPIKCKFVSLSPFSIKVIDNKYFLFWDDALICETQISFIPDTLINKTTRSGVPYDAIINLANDRIRINPAPICVYKQEKLSCKFCNLPNENITYNINDIIEVIDYCLINVKFRHFLIGGGTYSKNGGWNIILRIAQYIHTKCNKDIYLMSIPPNELSILDKLKEAGITEVAFNLEIFDRKLAKTIMPGKGKLELEQYISVFEHSVKLWGNNGCVRSLLIYGFDSDELFLSGIEKLCCIGVEPIISIFRPLENTELLKLNPPPTADIFRIYEECKKIVQRYHLILGPDCPDCQNNTLSYTELF